MTTFEVPFEVEDKVCYSNQAHIFNTGKVISVESEVFVKVQDDETGEIQTYKPEALFSPQEAKNYVDQVQARLTNLLTPPTEPEE